MNTFRDVIDRWPEPAPVTLAADLGEEPGTVRQWRNRNVLPNRVWLSIVEVAQRRDIDGVTLEVLASIASAKKREGSAVRRRTAVFPPTSAPPRA